METFAPGGPGTSPSTFPKDRDFSPSPAPISPSGFGKSLYALCSPIWDSRAAERGKGLRFLFSSKADAKPHPGSPTHLGPPPSALHRLVGLLRFLKACVPRGGIKDGGMQARCEGLRGLCREAVWGRAPLHPASCIPSPAPTERKRKEAERKLIQLLSEEPLSSRFRFLCREGREWGSQRVQIAWGGRHWLVWGPETTVDGGRGSMPGRWVANMEGAGYLRSNYCFGNLLIPV